MKRTLLLTSLLLVLIGAAVTSAGPTVTPSRMQTVPGPGRWDCVADQLGTVSACSSTGPTNNGSLAVDAGSYLIGQCNAAAYVGLATTYNPADGGGTAPNCYQTDAGINTACKLRSANQIFYLDLRNTSRNSIGCTSVTGTATCAVSACVN